MDAVEWNIRSDIGEGFQFQLLHDFLFEDIDERRIPYLSHKFSTYNDLLEQFSERDMYFALKAAFCFSISDRMNSSTLFSSYALFHPYTGEKKQFPGMLKAYCYDYLHDEALDAVLTYEVFKIHIEENWKHYQATMSSDYDAYFSPIVLYIAIVETVDGHIELYACC